MHFILEAYNAREIAIIKTLYPSASIQHLFGQGETYKCTKRVLRDRWKSVELPEKAFICGSNLARIVYDWNSKDDKYRRTTKDGYIFVASPSDEGFAKDFLLIDPAWGRNSILSDNVPIVLDIETTGLNPWKDDIVSVGLAWGEMSAWAGTLEEFKKLNIKPSIIIGHNLKFDLLFLKVKGVDLTNYPIWDTMVAEYLINENNSLGLDQLIFKYTNYRNYWADIDYSKFANREYRHTMLVYNIQDVLATWEVYTKQPRSFRQSLFDFEMSKLKTLLEIEYNGMYVDWEGLVAKMQNCEAEILGLTWELHEMQPTLNLKSGKQLAKYLYEDLKLPILETTEKGNPSTSAETLEKLVKEFPLQTGQFLPKLSTLRQKEKLYNTYYENIKANTNNEDRMLHGRFNQTTVVTGRLSSSGGVNFQNIPARDSSLVEELFVSRYIGGSIIKCDYSQMEIRVLAAVSGDKAMIEAFKKGEDFHEVTARALSIERRDAKTVNFAVIYGGGSPEITKRWFAAYPDAFKWVELQRSLYRKQHQTESPLGRQRRVGPPGPYAKTFYRQGYKVVYDGHKERQAFNSIIQGMASDLNLVGVYLLNKYLTSKTRAVIINTIHDSILIDCPSKDLHEKLLADIQNILQVEVPNFVRSHFNYEFTCPLKIDVSYGPSWGSQDEESTSESNFKISGGGV